MDAAMAWLRDGEMHKVDLEVWPDSERAIGPCERYGFEVEGTRREPLPPQGRLAALLGDHGEAA